MQTRHSRLGERGVVTPFMLVMLTVFMIFATSLMSWSLSERKNVMRKERSNEALAVAEAGVSYYMWHLAHNGTDYKDGQSWCCNNDDSSTAASCGGMCGPYTHEYRDYEGNLVGDYSISIKPPMTGSTILEIRAVGKTSGDATLTKTVTAKLGKKSLSTFSLLSNAPFWIGEHEHVTGPLHSNGGIRFDGTTDAEVTSAVATYDAQAAHHLGSTNAPGIWGSTDPNVTKYWSFPEPIVDYDRFTLSMANVKDGAKNRGGIYLAPSGKGGYQLIFSVVNGVGKITVYRVDSVGQKTKYLNDEGVATDDYEGVNQTTLIGTYNYPANGLIFVEDDVWVKGTVKGRATVAASNFSDCEACSNYARILIDDNLFYTAKDGTDVLGLMAEGDILVPRHAPTYLTINAMLLSQKGHVYRRIYKSSYVAQSLTVYGGVVTDKFWTWTWVDEEDKPIDGYKVTNTSYDYYLTYGPPPLFPTEDSFSIISWTAK